jgi:hypothetical protein
MEALAIDDDPKTTKKGTKIYPSNPNRAKNLMEDISRIIDNDIENDDSAAPAKVKKSRVITTKDFLENKKNRFPSATELMNNPLKDSFQGLEGDEDMMASGPASRSSLGRITAKDLNRSFADSLDIKASSPKTKKKSKSKSDVTRLSAAQLVNDTLRQSNGGIAEELKKVAGNQPLGVTAKDLRAIEKNIVATGGSGKDKATPLYKSKSKGSIGAQLNAPLKASLDGLDGGKPSLPKSLEGRPDDNTVYKAKESHKKKHAHERI